MKISIGAHPTRTIAIRSVDSLFAFPRYKINPKGWYHPTRLRKNYRLRYPLQCAPYKNYRLRYPLS